MTLAIIIIFILIKIVRTQFIHKSIAVNIQHTYDKIITEKLVKCPHRKCRGAKRCCDTSVCLSICLCSCSYGKTVRLGIWLLWNANSKFHGGSGTHRSAWPYDYRNKHHHIGTHKLFIICRNQKYRYRLITGKD